MIKNREFLYTTTYASGFIIINEYNIIIDTCPIYKKLKGQNINQLKGKLQELNLDKK